MLRVIKITANDLKSHEAFYIVQDWPLTYEEAVFDKKMPRYVGFTYNTDEWGEGAFIKKKYLKEFSEEDAIKVMRRHREAGLEVRV